MKFTASFYVLASSLSHYSASILYCSGTVMSAKTGVPPGKII